MVCFNLGELDQAGELFTRAAAIASKANGEDHPSVAAALLGVAEVATRRGKLEEALTLYERVVALRERAEIQPVDRGVSRFALARALRALGKDPERARQLALAARDELLTVGDAQRERIELIDAFLADGSP
jgi:tetratricopeptide (TPR) repeat protein